MKISSEDVSGASYERAVGAFDLFLLDDAPERDLNDVSVVTMY